MKKLLSALIALAMMLSCLMVPAALADEKISIVTTIFPIYDWVREVAGSNLDNIDLTMLLGNGVELHSYQPTVQDIVKVSESDLFIYVGGESDAWVKDVLATASNPDLRSINLVEAMGADIKAEEIVEGMEHEHEHEEGDAHEEEAHEAEAHEHEEHEHEEEMDEHVWLSLRNAEKLVQVIADAMAEIDAANADAYRVNAAAYIEKLAALDAEYQKAVDGASVKTVLFGDRFPFRYMVDDYGLSYYAAFSGCSAESEASFSTIVFLAQKVNELDLPAVLSIEGANHKIAETVAATSDHKDAKILTMDSLQSTTAEQVAQGTTYLSVMESNLAVLKDALTR